MELRAAKLGFIEENAKALTTVELVVMVRELVQELPQAFHNALFCEDGISLVEITHLDDKQDSLLVLLAELEMRGVLRNLEEKLVFDLVG
jgi:hypothetical protein